MCIQVLQTGQSFRAQVVGKPGFSGVGDSREAAIGALVLNWAGLFGVTVRVDAGPRT